MNLKCLQCTNNDVSFWCLDKFCEKNLICDQCQVRHGNVEKIFNPKNNIKAWVKKMMKQMLSIMERINRYQEEIEKLFSYTQQNQNQDRNALINQQQNQNEDGNNQNQDRNIQVNQQQIQLEIYQKRLNRYSQYLQFNPQIQSTLFILNNQLNNYFFPQSYNKDAVDNLQQLDNCKKLIHDKYYAKASQEIQSLDPDDSQYFQIELLILQNNLKHALELSEQAVRSNPTFKLELQQAKILHKQKQYAQAQKILRKYESTQGENEQLQLQLAKTIIKCGYIDLGRQTINNIKGRLENENNNISQEGRDFLKSIEFRLAYAKANLQAISDDRCSQNSSQQMSEDQNLQNNQNINDVKTTYEKILKEEPTNQSALYGLSQTLIIQKELIKARELLYQLIQLNPKYRKAERALMFIKMKLLDQQQDDLEGQFDTFGGVMGYVYQFCCSKFGGDQQQQ
ncbi:unnamed protein product [Paramecium octaurelia]|uniref:Tetratricopeptide repeat protein n=1 Tax=Paramecium octaurelia TaxID=43137 RepID=A0A8S1XRZ3_PAROT|nr:unnamed protein product [Paramecium octaurelia]